MSFYIDLSEFLQNPITTGIQRIAGELCKWSPPNTLMPVRLHAGRYVGLPSALIDAIVRLFTDAGQSRVDDIRRLAVSETGSAIRMSEEDIVLVPEVFDDPARLKFFREMPEAELRRYRFIVFDLLPMTHPEYFPAGCAVSIYGYYGVVRKVSCGFISEHTRDDYYARLKKITTNGGVVLPLGCDALGPKPETLSLNRPRTFSVLGTVEPRKNHEMILEAFESLLPQIPDLRLAFIGKMGWVDSEFAYKVRALAADKNSGFHFHSVSGDREIRRCIEQSRATIYISAAEGYGLPPVESLWVGTPVIASNMIPSLKRLGSNGIHFVEPLNPINLRRAVLAFLSDNYANQKTQEIQDLNLPTWRSFTQEVLRWCEQERG